MVKENYTEHNPSQTILTKDDEWIKAANWLYEHWNIIGGLTFLPKDNTVYQLAPFDGHQVNWKLFSARNSIYENEEKRAVERHFS